METAITLGASLARTLGPFEPIDLRPPPAQPDAPLPRVSTDSAPRYQEMHTLGRGGLGEVVEAFDQDLRRHVAIKRPRDDRMSERQQLALVEEAQITAQLDHPCIPPVHGIGIDDQQRPYFSMALVTGQNLDELLRLRRTDPQVRASLGMSRLLHIFTQVGYAVAFAHARGVVHRDIKPDNVMIGQFGEVRLMDWGVAKVLHRTEERRGEAVALAHAAQEGGVGAQDTAPDTAHHPARGLDLSTDRPQTRVGTFIGTPGYAAPEQVEGRADLDARADIYALGALLYVILSGQLPVAGKTPLEWMFHTVEGNVTPIKHLVPISDALAAITHKALAKNPSDRYASALAMLEDLDAMHQGKPVSALREAACARVGRWYMSRPPGLARMRVIDFDLMMWASFCLGTSLMAALLLWTSLPVYWLGVGALIVAVLSGALPAYTWLRKPSPDDPWHLLSPASLHSGSTSHRSVSDISYEATAAAP
jgi:eukaryotic-like serine/threonine-protein kinase